MADYKTTDKTEWFIRKMRSGWFTRREIVGQAASEFPDIPSKTLDGTMGQYWSDSVNPKWGTYKAIRALGLTVEEKDGRRRIMPNGGASTTASASYKVPSVKTLQAQPRRSVSRTDRRDEVDQYSASKTREMWNSNKLELWEQALARYWTKVKASNLALEKEMAQLNVEVIRVMDPQAWYWFLLEKYFRWKYTALNRYGSTTKSLKTYESKSELPLLHSIKEQIFALDKNDIRKCLTVANSIRGLGTAGASGLLAVLFPAQFGTVDQFAVKALVQIPELPEKDLIAAMNPESLKLNEGAILVRIMRMKAAELNRVLSTTEWTPRKVDMVLWTCAR